MLKWFRRWFGVESKPAIKPTHFPACPECDRKVHKVKIYGQESFSCDLESGACLRWGPWEQRIKSNAQVK